ncbi:MAG TPA: hypothetical protein VFU12_19045 [Glycomyces sp.]|nr:hypothetical protein [Glycomyces sp.]
MTVDYLSRHLKRDVGLQDFDPSAGRLEDGRAMSSAELLIGRVGRIRMRSLWKESGYAGAASPVPRHRRSRL